LPSIEHVLQEIVSQLPGYEPRPQQVEMARLVGDAIASGRHALIEAGTGSGKSFGYLVPLIESGKTAVISTGTIALQEQLLHKDIPFLAQAYGREIKVALAKGRSNYICLRKLEEAIRTLSPADSLQSVATELFQMAGDGRWSGDRADLPFNVESRFWADALASDPEDCLGPKCPNFGFTPHRQARQACEEAQILIANHALYFTDLAMGGGVLPKHDVVVFDEAQHLERAATGALSVQISRWIGSKLLQRVQRRFSTIPLQLIQALNDAENELMDHLYLRGRGQFRIERNPDFEDRAFRMAQVLAQLAGWLGKTDISQMLLIDADPAMAKQRAEVVREQMQSVAQDLARSWEHFASLREGDERANWMIVDPGRDYYELQSAPLDVGEALDQLLWRERTCILTSATLAVDGKFDFIRQEVGVPGDPIEAVLGSPFDFSQQALLYIPRSVPLPSDPRFTEAICPEIERLLRMTEGRAFVLCTSYRSLREISATLMPRLPYPCKTQEDLPRARLIEWFKSTSNAVLFATATFWEGVDVPGDALSCVIIDKLPFASPDDPIVQARTERMKARDEDWFGGYMLPKAVLALKQGFGRLIRTRTDRGIVAIMDKRVLTMRYGEIVLRSLPPARRIFSPAPTLDAAFETTAARAATGGRSGWAGTEPEPVYQGRWSPPPPDLDAVLGEPPP
jgi:ATP-dependent DNA helicase DinG